MTWLNLYMEDASAMPLYDIGSLGSFGPDFGIGLIMHFFHRDGILPFSKHMLNKMFKNNTDMSLNKTTTGIASIPHALPLLELYKAFLTSNIEMWSLNIGSRDAGLLWLAELLPQWFCCTSFPCWQWRRELKSCFHLLLVSTVFGSGLRQVYRLSSKSKITITVIYKLFLETIPVKTFRTLHLLIKFFSSGYIIRFEFRFSDLFSGIIWAASSEFGTYRLCEQRMFRRACASAQSRQNLRCSLIQAVNQEEPSDRKPDPWPIWMAGHAQLKFVMTECSKAQIRLTGPICHKTHCLIRKMWTFPKDAIISVCRMLLHRPFL